MKFALVAVVLACLVFAVQSSEPEVKNGLYVITTENYDEALKTFPPTLYVFSASWCAPCQALHPELVEAAKTLVKSKVNARIATIDVDKEDDVVAKHKIIVIPTLKFYGTDHQFVEYDGSRDAKDLVKYIVDHV